jgi:hypothetical protein
MTKQFREGGRYNPTSRENMIKEAMGGFANSEKKWTREEDDLMLENYLVKNLPYVASDGVDSFQVAMERSWDSVGTRVRKICAKVETGAGYQPQKRTDRTGAPFTGRDHYLLKIMTLPDGRAREHGVGPVWMASVLGRDVGEVLDYLEKLAHKRASLDGGLDQPSPPDNKATPPQRLEALFRDCDDYIAAIFKDAALGS